jgi:hypothetical protein
MLVLLSGCSRDGSGSNFESLSGVVESRNPSGELAVRLLSAGGADAIVRQCVITNDSEVYINGQFRDVDAIRPGDSIELVGYPDHDRFAISLIYIRRPEPPAALPELLARPLPAPSQSQPE